MPSQNWSNARETLILDFRKLGLEAETLARMDELISVYQYTSDARTFVAAAAHTLDYKAGLLRRLNVVLAEADITASLAVIEEFPEVPSSPILVVLFRHWHNGDGEVLRFPTSPDLDCVYATTSSLTSSLDSEVFTQQLQQLPSSLASCMMDLLLLEFKRTFLPTRRRVCNRLLRHLSDLHGVLPPSFLIYDIEKDGGNPVACGGFADIYKGRLRSPPVCLKVLRYFANATPTDRQRLIKLFCREALAWKRLDHPNILPFIGIAADLFHPSFCLVSPWMNNGNIMCFLDKNPTYDRLKAVTEIAGAIKYLHNCDPPVVHADIRGANILVTDDLRCCLTDFGLTSVSETQTSSMASHGALRWMAPEYLQPEPMSNLPSRDIYAFGCTILEVYTGKSPFHYHRSDANVLYEVLAGRRPRKDGFQLDSIWALIDACWYQDLNSRPSAGKVLEILERHGQTKKASHNRRRQEATFICPVPGCGSTFTRSFNLKGHIRSHNEEKPFLCHWPGCGKGFAREHDCKRHEQLHANYRPFTCEGCNKPFARMDALNRHLHSEGGAECRQVLSEANGTFPPAAGVSYPFLSNESVETQFSPASPIDIDLPYDTWPEVGMEVDMADI